MKKLLLSIIAFAGILGCLTANAQLRYGPTAGVNLTTLKFSQELFDVDQSVGYQAGLQGELMFPGIGFGIDFAALYSQQGATCDLGSREIWASSGYGKERSYLHYLQIPVNMRFKWTRMAGLEDYVAPYVFGGPVFSFLVAHNKLKVFDYAGADLGLQCGLGFEFKRRWQLQGSYIWGMTYALKAEKLMNFTGRNRSWQVRVAYMF